MSSLSVRYCRFYMELRFTWDKSVQVHCSASCQLSNLGTKAWREVAAYYGTSVKNAGSIFRVSEIDSTWRQGSSTVGGNGEKAVLPQFRPSCRSAARVPFSRSSAVWLEGGVYICTLAINHTQRKQHGGCRRVFQTNVQLGKKALIRS